MKSIAALLVKLAMLACLAGWAAPVAASGLKAPINTGVSVETALADARRLATAPGDMVLRVKGTSMLPYFGEGSVLVVRKTAAELLRPGMVVLYRNRFGETVAHRIEERSGEGWRVRGANNAASDSTLVTAENLLGGVYVTLHADPRTESASALASTASGDVAVALAAPAR